MQTRRFAVIETIKQGLDTLDTLTAEQVDAHIASAMTAFREADAAGNAAEMQECLAATQTFTARREALKASANGNGDEPAAEPAPAEEAPPTEAPAADATTASTDEPAPEPEPTPTTDEPATDDSSAPAEGTTASADTSEPPEADPAPAGAEAQAENTTSSEETTVTASASVDTAIEVPEDNKPVATTQGMPTTILAGMDVQGTSAGSPFKTAEDVGKAFAQRIRAIKRAAGGDGEKHTVATVMASYPEDRILDGDFQGNAKKINAVLQQAMVASGGYCAPLPVRYDIFGVGVTDRPVRDSLLMFNASRGGVRFVTPPVLTDLEDAVGLWTSTIDASPGTAVKAELKVTCAAEVDAESDAVTLQLEFGNFMTRAYPELVNRNNELGLIQHARFAELELLSKMTALSTQVTSAAKLGVGRDFLNAIARGAAAYRSRHRMRRTTPLRVIAPEWVQDAMRTDFSQQLPGDDAVAYADARIEAFLAAQNVRVSWHLDGPFAAQAGSAPLVEFPSTFTWHLFAEGSFLFLDGGTLDIGVVRDSALVSTNDYKVFMETFEGVAMIGVEALSVVQESEIEGATVGTIAPTGS
jgi:hypothetical protein